MSYQKKLARLDKKWLSYGKKRIPKYGIIGILSAILAHNLAKYQLSIFATKPSSFDKNYQITYSLSF